MRISSFLLVALLMGLTACTGTSSANRPYYAALVALNSRPEILEGIHAAFLTVPDLQAKTGGKPSSDGSAYYDARGRQSGALIRIAEYYGELVDSPTRFGYRLLIGAEANSAAARADVDRLVDDIHKTIAPVAGGAKFIIHRNVNLTP